MQITSAMKMVSAAKLKRAQDAIVQMRPYAEKLTSILGNISASLDSSEGVYSRENGKAKVLIIPITSNRGLCGAFNSSVIKATTRLIQASYSESQVTVMSIGKKANEFFKKTDFAIRGTFLPRETEKLFDDMSFENISEAAAKVMKAFEHKDFDQIILVYNQFKNAATQIIMAENFLPVQAAENEGAVVGDYLFEPTKQEIVEQLIPKSLKTQLFKAVIDTHAAEHGARMTAMHKATDNASELRKELTLTYNKARQAAITAEILEIVGGAEALKG